MSQNKANTVLLPVSMYPNEARWILERAGVKFGEKKDNFCAAKLPPGWTLVGGTDKVSIMDGHGRCRAKIIRKIDDGHLDGSYVQLWLAARFSIEESQAPDGFEVKVWDGEKIQLFLATQKFRSKDPVKALRICLELRKKAIQWLNENYPGWQKPTIWLD